MTGPNIYRQCNITKTKDQSKETSGIWTDCLTLSSWPQTW